MNQINKNKKEEHILICLSSSPSNPKVIKAGAAMAESYRAKLTGLYIETERILNLTDKKRFENNILLAKSYGAQIITLNGNNIPYKVAKFAKDNLVTKLLIGHSGYKPQNTLLQIFKHKSLQQSFTDKLISLIPNVEVHIIPDNTKTLYLNKKEYNFDIPRFTIKDTFFSSIILIIATILGMGFKHIEIYDSNIILIYILAILSISSNTKNAIYGILSSCIAVFLYNFFFVEPYFSTEFSNKNYAITFITMLIVALISSSMTKRMKEQTNEALQRTYRTEALLDLSQKLQECYTEKDINNALLEQVQQLFECNIVLYSQKNNTNPILSWVFDNKKSSSQLSNIDNKENSLYIPICNQDKVYGVIKLDKKHINKFEENLVFAMIRESVLALEKNITRKINNELLIKNKQEELRTTLLRTISHDLRTPLTGISGYAELLKKKSAQLPENKKNQIYNDIYDDSIWLLNLVENILSITRFDKDKIELKKEIEFIPDIITEAISHLRNKIENYNIIINIPDDELYSIIDGRLIVQVIFNLVDNAIKYSAKNSKIEIKATKKDGYITISVIDEGCGISNENKNKIFDIFYTINHSISETRRGLGLGLALCKSVIDAHSSNLEIKDNIPCGTIFSFKLKEYKDE